MLNNITEQRKIFLELLQKIKDEAQTQLDKFFTRYQESVAKVKETNNPILCKVKRAMLS
jgi:hypothetical protein